MFILIAHNEMIYEPKIPTFANTTNKEVFSKQSHLTDRIKNKWGGQSPPQSFIFNVQTAAFYKPATLKLMPL
jgi:hypothetical protein